MSPARTGVDYEVFRQLAPEAYSTLLALGKAVDDARGVTGEAHEAVRRYLTETELVFRTLALGTINNWNRLGVALRFAPPILRQAGAA